MGSRVSVRRARPDEADASLLASLGARLFEQAFGALNEPGDVRLFLAATYAPHLQLAELEDVDRVAWIAESDGEPVGYALLRRGSRSELVPARSPAEVQRIYVDRSQHGLGAGHDLMSACVDQARAWGCDVLWLGTWNRNARGLAFYEKWGFRHAGTQRFLVGTDSQVDYVLALAL